MNQTVDKYVVPLSKPLVGKIEIPADKSISHRAIMFSSIAEGSCIIRNFSSGADCHSTLNLFKDLGVSIEFIDSKTLKVNSSGVLKKPNKFLDAGNSGTTMRLVSGILAGQNFDTVLVGDESLSKRPMKRIIDPLTQMGAVIESNNGCAPLKIKGSPLKGIKYCSKLSSAQVKSCVLLAGLSAAGETTFQEPFVSRDHTERMLKYLGADISVNNNSVTIKPSKLIARDIDIVGDISSAAFFIVAGLIVKDSDFVISNVGVNSTRAGIIDIVQRMGGNIEIINKRIVSGEDVADIRVMYSPSLKGCIVSGEDIPRLIDELPVIAVLASQAEGKTLVKNAEDLRNKESDRIKCLVKELTKLGIEIIETEDGFEVSKSDISGGAELNVYHDHRLAMSFYVASLIANKPVLIKEFNWTNISFPEFESLFKLLQ